MDKFNFCSKVQKEAIEKYVEEQFHSNILPALMDFVRIPNLSPAFDPEWETNGTLLKAATFLKDWVLKQDLKNATVEVVQEQGQPPLVFIEVAATDCSNKTVLFYGHYDKQPHFTGWMEGTGPTTPAIIGDCLYGRGCSDDGYAIFASVLSIKACQVLGYGHPKCVITIEGEEETDSAYYMTYLDKLSPRVGTPDFVFCLDSGCSDYKTMWLTTSLRGILEADLTVQVLTEGVHSGDSSGIVPTPFRIITQLLSRIENIENGRIHDAFQVNIPPHRYEEAYRVAEIKQENVYNKFPFHSKMTPTTTNPLEAYLNRTWRAQLSIVGADGLPPAKTAGNVLLPVNTFKLSLRLPPTLDAEKAKHDIKRILEENPPYNSQVICKVHDSAEGWSAPKLHEVLDKSMNAASENFFGKLVECQGEGGSIPLMNDLKRKYPNIQFIVTGILGPHSNAHGPNEMLHIPYTKKIMCCITQILADTSSSFSV
ncbi:M20/M25/M40 family peptidase (macronuclear) [Tetrahymena thermophila SB210]|uniref:M20/M25/M40 family peptidase n=1 Tax=Tetrahymena thermophila (strain SB210) TaxID=312017 RepID=I7MER5_TETTS|nr:M20/M25/M40 family peptidase [Tetrahymena thermophila SB210]EAR97425.1 M20/M25/M40 family peptidase [Tetrahymena thermophila SB210]|eukprot:XP_001017670.1 M20/M25/M40 family peptidase [Tetrahymena thermophila SB210]